MESLPNPISAFSPTPAQAEFIIHSITSRDTTLAHIGAHCGVTVETLTCWLASPAIRARLDAADTTTCHAIRVRANVLTPLVLAAAARIIDDFLLVPTPTPIPSPHARSIDLALRRAETVRKAAALIVRLTRHQPAHTRRAASPLAPTAAAPPNTSPESSDRQIHSDPTSPAPTPQSEIAPLTSAEHPSAVTTAHAARDISTAPANQPELPAPQSNQQLPAPNTCTTPTTPDSPAPTTVEHVLDLIATLSPEQIADLTALTAPHDPNAQLVLTAEDSS